MKPNTMTLYDNPFSPFARKVRMVLDHKGFEFESIDALTLERLPELRRRNPRAEVPVLLDDDLVIIDSECIVDYLEDVQPVPSIYPKSPRDRARARKWQRVADRTIDAIVHDMSLWIWPTHKRTDSAPEGLLEAGRGDLLAILADLEGDLRAHGFVCGDVSIADFALFPHVSVLRLLGLPLDPDRHAAIKAWERRMREVPAVANDLRRVRAAVDEKFRSGSSPYEAHSVVWRGDRIEWLLSKGFDAWWSEERSSGRAVIPSSVHAARGTPEGS